MATTDRIVELIAVMVATALMAGTWGYVTGAKDEMHKENCAKLRQINMADENGYCKGW